MTMNRQHENACFGRFQQTRDPGLLAEVFDATAAELLRVASHLANGNRELTEDALQATFLTAIEHASRYDRARDVRPWLLGILANHVRKERRRARQPAGDPVDPATTASTLSRAADAEFSTAATEAIRQLPTPFREAIVLHLQHGLTAAEIGEALGRPAGTVRTQIVRGLERLRGLLPASFAAATIGVGLLPANVLAAVRHQLLSTLPAPVLGSSSVALSGWRLYTMMTAAAALLCSALLPWLWSSDPTIPTTATAVTGNVGAASTPADGLVREAIGSSDTYALAATADTLPIQGGEADADSIAVRIQVTYGSDGSPAANVIVGMREHASLRQWTTNAAGMIETRLPWPGMHSLYVLGTPTSAHFSWPAFAARPETVDLPLVIEPGMALDLRVVDADGDPVAGALVESNAGSQPVSMLSPIGRTDADGRLVRRDLAPGGQFRAWSNDHLPSRIRNAPSGIGKGQTCEIELRLPGKGERVRGVVRDENGKPLAGARLALVQFRNIPTEPQFFTSAADGTFAIGTLYRGRHVLVGQHLDGARRRGLLRFAHDGADCPELELQLTLGARITGRLTNSLGDGLGNVNVVARDMPEAIHGLPFLGTWARTEPDGSFELSGLVAGNYRLECDNVASEVMAVAAGTTSQWNPVRVPLQRVKARILDQQGRPLEGWSVSLIEPGADYTSRSTLTDADGWMRSTDSHGWSFPVGSFYRLTISKKLGQPDVEEWNDHSRLPNLITPPLAIGLEHEIRVPAKAMPMHQVTGRLIDTAGAPLQGQVTLIGSLGQAYPVGANTDAATGAFELVNIPPGRYGVSARIAGRPRLSLGQHEARAGRPVTLGDITVPELGAAVLTCTTPTVPENLHLELVGQHGNTHRLRHQSDGNWSASKLYRGDYQLRGWSDDVIVEAKTITVGEHRTPTEFALTSHAATELTIELDESTPRNVSGFSCDLTVHSDDFRIERGLYRAFRGAVERRVVFHVQLPAGRHDLQIRDWYRRLAKGTVDVPAGGGGKVVLRFE